MDKIEPTKDNLSSPESSLIDSGSGSASAKTVPLLEVSDPQVKPKRGYAPRRKFTCAYKQKILTAYDACCDAKERGELLRREGLYSSRISAWRKNQSASESSLTKSGKLNKQAVRIEHLTRENEKLKKKLSHATAIIELQKKVSDLLGSPILLQEKDETH